MTRHFLSVIAILAALYATAANAATDPDTLYRQGKFEEAQKAYAEADMNNPKDIRYRYNRGCAAYENSDYKSAEAAFSSVLKRTEDKEIRYKALYNLGNTAFKQKKFETASSYYKQAIICNPGNQGAGYNLELSLRELEKQKKNNNNQKNEPEQNSQNKEDKPGQSGESKNDENKKQKNSDKKPPKPNPLQEAPQQKESMTQVENMSALDKKKANELLDSIREDRSNLLRFQSPDNIKEGVRSGKDW